MDDNNEAKVYALGFYTKQHGCHTFYIKETLDSDELIMRCLDSMICNKYDDYIFYVHNLGKFDIYFLLSALVKSDKYKFEFLSRDSLILSITIKADYKVNKRLLKRIKKSIRMSNIILIIVSLLLIVIIY